MRTVILMMTLWAAMVSENLSADGRAPVNPHTLDFEPRLGPLELGSTPDQLKAKGLTLVQTFSSPDARLTKWDLEQTGLVPADVDAVQLVFLDGILFSVRLRTDDPDKAEPLEVLYRRLRNPEGTDKSMVCDFYFKPLTSSTSAELEIQAKPLQFRYQDWWNQKGNLSIKMQDEQGRLKP